MLRIFIEIVRDFGLIINKEKINFMVFNLNTDIDNVEDIRVTDNITYLGVKVTKNSFLDSSKKIKYQKPNP